MMCQHSSGLETTLRRDGWKLWAGVPHALAANLERTKT